MYYNIILVVKKHGKKSSLKELKKNFKKVLTTKKILCYNGGVAVRKQVKKKIEKKTCILKEPMLQWRRSRWKTS